MYFPSSQLFFKHFLLSTYRPYGDHVHPPHGWGRPSQWPGGHPLSGSPLLLRIPHLPQELFWRRLLPHSCASDEKRSAKGGEEATSVFLCICLCMTQKAEALSEMAILGYQWFYVSSPTYNKCDVLIWNKIKKCGFWTKCWAFSSTFCLAKCLKDEVEQKDFSFLFNEPFGVSLCCSPAVIAHRIVPANVQSVPSLKPTMKRPKPLTDRWTVGFLSLLPKKQHIFIFTNHSTTM